MCVATPIGDSLVVDRVYRYYMSILGYDIRANLILLDMVDFDLSLGMD